MCGPQPPGPCLRSAVATTSRRLDAPAASEVREVKVRELRAGWAAKGAARDGGICTDTPTLCRLPEATIIL